MAKNARNKRYTPKHQHAQGGLCVFARRTQLEGESVTNLSLAHWLAFDNLTRGASPTAIDFEHIVSSLNTGIVLTELGFQAEAEHVFQRALDGAFTAKERGMRTNVWRFNGGDIETIRAALAIHDEQYRAMTHGDLERACMLVEKRMAEGRTYDESHLLPQAA